MEFFWTLVCLLCNWITLNEDFLTSTMVRILNVFVVFKSSASWYAYGHDGKADCEGSRQHLFRERPDEHFLAVWRRYFLGSNRYVLLSWVFRFLSCSACNWTRTSKKTDWNDYSTGLIDRISSTERKDKISQIARPFPEDISSSPCIC